MSGLLCAPHPLPSAAPICHFTAYPTLHPSLTSSHPISHLAAPQPHPPRPHALEVLQRRHCILALGNHQGTARKGTSDAVWPVASIAVPFYDLGLQR